VLFIPLLVYWLALFVGTSIPSDHLSLGLEISDKLKHLFAYLFLAFLLSLNLHFQNRWEKLSNLAFIYSFIICILYGAFDEIHQLIVPNRSAEFLDWLANALGSILGVLLAFFILRALKKRKYQTET
jgi:VanZ family protein